MDITRRIKFPDCEEVNLTDWENTESQFLTDMEYLFSEMDNYIIGNWDDIKI